MTNGAVISFAPAIFESDDLLILALLDYFTGYLRPRKWASVADFVAVGMHQDILESELLARFTFEQIDIDRVAFGNPILSATGPDNCVRHSLGKRAGNIH